MRVHACTNIRGVSAPYLTVCVCIVWSHDHLEYVLIVQVNHCHEEHMAKRKQEMERIIASKDDEISQLQVQNKHLVSYCDELLTQTEQKATEVASKDEQIALLQLGSKELTDLQEEIQAKNQQVTKYKKQVDTYKSELERCQKELERCQKELERCQKKLERCQGELLEVNVMGIMIIWLVMLPHASLWGVHMFTCMCARVHGCVCTCRCVLVCVMCTQLNFNN